MQVVGADGSDLGAVGTIECKITIGDIEVEQTFIVCRHLRRNVILGTDFTKTTRQEFRGRGRGPDFYQ